MMEGTRSLQPWFITGGTHTGIMKYVGEARARSEGEGEGEGERELHFTQPL